MGQTILAAAAFQAASLLVGEVSALQQQEPFGTPIFHVLLIVRH